MKVNRTIPLATLVLAFLLQGCNPVKKDQPSKQQIQSAVAEAAPPFVIVVDVTPEFLPGSTDK